MKLRADYNNARAEAKAEDALAQKIAERVSFNVGCMNGMRAVFRMRSDEPLDVLYADWCTTFAAQWAGSTTFETK
jgi:hypothetical protein